MKLTLKKDVVQTGTIKVHTHIIKDLSSGIYSSPANCVKELVNNSFDADANLVTIRIKPIEDSITIIDDGDGMNAIDFDENFAWISKSNKRNEGLFSNSGRPLIGKIGIGFIAVNEICEELEVTSTKKNESIRFTARINFKKYFTEDSESEGGIIKGEFELMNSDEDSGSHYTIIQLLGLKDSVKQILKDQQYYSQLAREKNKYFNKNNFFSMGAILDHHFNKKLRSFDEDNEYIKFILDLAAYIPVEYIENGPIANAHDKILDKIVAEQKKLNFKVDLDGIFLKKPIYFQIPKTKKNAYYTFKDEIKVANSKPIEIVGYFYVQNQILFPRELNGIAIRIKNIPIAQRYGFDTTFLNYPNYMFQIFRNWISGEVYVINDALEEAMNIDRKSFRQTHPEYLALQNYIHQILNEKVFGLIAQELYKKGKTKREQKQQSEKKKYLKEILKKDVKFNEINFNSNQLFPVNIEKKKNEFQINVDKDFKKNFSKRDWELVEDILIFFSLAEIESQGDLKKLKKEFIDSLLKWVKK